MESAGTSERNEREVGWVVPALHGDNTEGSLHGRVGHSQNPLGSVLEARVQALGKAGKRGLDSVPVERTFTTQKGIGGKATEPDVGVGDRDGVPSLPLADGTGVGTGGLGAHP